MLLKLSNKEVEKLAKKVIAQIIDQEFEVKKIVSIAYGGLIPTYYIGKKLNVDLISVVRAVSHEDRKKGKVVLAKETNSLFDDSEGILVIDDIVETSDTLDLVCGKLFPNAMTATLLKYPGAPEPDFVGGTIEDSIDWVAFPWENN